ncbi:hemagglutinin protein HagB [Porphyromonas gingivalis F0568]|nr:hemagglutinin protein HagB [Porphyromonas gingivalis F0568]
MSLDTATNNRLIINQIQQKKETQMTVENLRLQRLQNLEHYRFAKNVLTLCRTANIAKLNPKLPELEKAIEMEDLALNPPVANELTPQVIALDEERDRAYQALMSRVRSYAFDEDSQLRNAAARIEDVAARYGNVIRMNYDKETAAIENFLTDLKGENIRPLVTKLGVTALVDRLEKNNKAFADFFLRRLSTDQRGKYDVKALRAETDRTLVAVVRRMDSIDDMEPSPEIRALIELYNRLVANRRALLARRASYGEAAVEKRRAEIAEMLRPLLARIVEEKKTAVFAGRTLGTGKNRHYLITFVAENGDEEDRWYRIDGEQLVYVPEDELPKPKKKKKPASSTDTPSEPPVLPNPSQEGGSSSGGGEQGSTGGGL